MERAQSEPKSDDAARCQASRRICIILPGLLAGGTERVVSILANEWNARGHTVTLITFNLAGLLPYYPIDPEVEILNLSCPPCKQRGIKAVAASLRRIYLLRHAIAQSSPDVVFSFLTRTNVMTLVASQGLGIPVIVSERNNPAHQNVGPVWGFLRSTFYPRAFGLVTMTSGALNYFPASVRRRSWVIPNPVDLGEVQPQRRGNKVITGVGRLVPQKGFDLLLKAFAQISPRFSDWKLVIWGEGPERAVLEAERARLGLCGRVEFPGITKTPGTWVDTADVFVLSSRFEGWGMVLLEAMAADLPVASFDCQWGPREMISHGENGLLVEPENVEALAAALCRLISDEQLRKKLGRAAGLSSQQFTSARVVDLWDEVMRLATAAPS